MRIRLQLQGSSDLNLRKVCFFVDTVACQNISDLCYLIKKRFYTGAGPNSQLQLLLDGNYVLLPQETINVVQNNDVYTARLIEAKSCISVGDNDGPKDQSIIGSSNSEVDQSITQQLKLPTSIINGQVSLRSTGTGFRENAGKEVVHSKTNASSKTDGLDQAKPHLVAHSSSCTSDSSSSSSDEEEPKPKKPCALSATPSSFVRNLKPISSTAGKSASPSLKPSATKVQQTSSSSSSSSSSDDSDRKKPVKTGAVKAKPVLKAHTSPMYDKTGKPLSKSSLPPKKVALESSSSSSSTSSEDEDTAAAKAKSSALSQVKKSDTDCVDFNIETRSQRAASKPLILPGQKDQGRVRIQKDVYDNISTIYSNTGSKTSESKSSLGDKSLTLTDISAQSGHLESTPATSERKTARNRKNRERRKKAAAFKRQGHKTEAVEEATPADCQQQEAVPSAMNSKSLAPKTWLPFVASANAERAPKDYSIYPIMARYPVHGDTIAFKCLEMTLSYTPELSSFKEAVVISFDLKTQEVELMLSAESAMKARGDGQSFGRFEMDPEELDGDDDRQRSYYWSDLQDVRLVQSGDVAGRHESSRLPMEAHALSDDRTGQYANATFDYADRIENLTNPPNVTVDF